MRTAHVHALNDANFGHEVLEQRDRPVLVSFTGTWAREGQALAPLVEQLAQDFGGKIKVGQLDFDASYPLAGIYGVRSAPAVVLFHAGRKIAHRLGVTTREDLVELLETVTLP